MTHRNKILLSVVAIGVAAAAFWFLVLAPKREEVAKLDTDIAAKTAEMEQARATLGSYEQAKRSYKRNYSTLARLGKAVPADDDVRSLIVQLDDAARRSNVDFRALNVGASDAAATTAGSTKTAAGTKAPPPGTVPVGSAGFSAMPFSFSFSGSFFTLSDFFQRLERFVTVQNDQIDVTGRLLLLGSIAVTPDAGDLSKLQAQIGAATYILPPAQGVTAGATPESPAGATPTDGGTVPNTSATITGVR